MSSSAGPARGSILSSRYHALAGYLVIGLLCAVAAACFTTFRHVEVEALEPPADSVAIQSPVKAHLIDGSTAVFLDGVSLARDTLWGGGILYGLNPAAEATVVGRIPLDSIVAMESFRTATSQPATTLSWGIPIALVVGVSLYCAANPKACFGSCPTFYSDSSGAFALEAEGFSYSIAPLLEARDVDRLAARPAEDGVLWLEVRNEALETHYINHVEILRVEHRPDEFVLPDAGGGPIGASRLVAPARAVDRAGRDVRALVSVADGTGYRTEPPTLDRAGEESLRDQIELTFPRPAGADSVALVLRLRNSLLTTVLLYEVMLGRSGARALDWVGVELERIGTAVELGRWYVEHMGMRVEVREDGEYREAAWIRDSGPIAWKDAAIVLAVPAEDSVRVRLSFVADNWRIDRVAIGAEYRRLAAATIPLSRVIAADDAESAAALQALRAPDDLYLETRPGNRFRIGFDAGAQDGAAHTYFLASQGYYIEWIRRTWLRSAGSAEPFRPSRESLHDALASWRMSREAAEAEFEATRIPVR